MAKIIPKKDSCTNSKTACRTGTGCQHHRKHTQHKGEGSHQDGAKTQLGGMNGRLY